MLVEITATQQPQPPIGERTPSRCCRHLAGSAFLGLICREDAGSAWVHGEPPFALCACIGTMNRSESPSLGLRPPSPPPKAGERAGRRGGSWRAPFRFFSACIGTMNLKRKPLRIKASVFRFMESASAQPTSFFKPMRCTFEERVVGLTPSNAAAPSGP